jgi:hypothetical protein
MMEVLIIGLRCNIAKANGQSAFMESEIQLEHLRTN